MDGGGVRCTVCPHLCVIADGTEGLCKARGARGGRLVSLTYGRPATIISDEIEKLEPPITRATKAPPMASGREAMMVIG